MRRHRDPMAALDLAWERYRERAKGILGGELSDDLRQQIREALAKQSKEIAAIA